MTIWTTGDMYLYDLTQRRDEPHWVPCALEHIEFGEEGYIDLRGYLPDERHLFDIAHTGVTLQVVARECGRADRYDNCVPFAELTDGTAYKFVPDLDQVGGAVILYVHVEGKVANVQGEQGEQ